MRVINQKNENLWEEVEHSLEEHSPSGYKMACVEAGKVFKHVLKNKGYPVGDINQIITLFGWKLTDKEGLKKAIKKTEQIKETFDYQMTSFEAEDIVEAYKQAIQDFSSAKALSWQRRFALLWQNYLSLKTSFAKKVLFGFFGFFLVVKLLAKTSIGHSVVKFFVGLADLIYSWFIFLAVLFLVAIIFVIIIFAYLEKKKTRIKSLDEKRS
jgi:hypothetical protein